MQPFNLSCPVDFEKWADQKLSFYRTDRIKDIAQAIVIGADGSVDEDRIKAIKQRVGRYGFALYRIDGRHEFGPGELNRLGDSLGLRQLDANLCASEDRISVITDESATEGNKQRYIPYSNRPLNWHTDGYYNPRHQAVRAFILHCNQPAASGGESGLIDPEIIYLFLRRKNPDFIRALCRPDVMQIPANDQDGKCLREKTCSSVFQISDDRRTMSMRYSQRKRHIHWLDDDLTQEALEELNRLLATDADWSLSMRLQAGEGIISNNALHCRRQYLDDKSSRREFLRARYYNAIETGTN